MGMATKVNIWKVFHLPILSDTAAQPVHSTVMYSITVQYSSHDFGGLLSTAQYMDFEICTVCTNRFSELQYYSVLHRFQSPYTACMVS